MLHLIGYIWISLLAAFAMGLATAYLVLRRRVQKTTPSAERLLPGQDPFQIAMDLRNQLEGMRHEIRMLKTERDQARAEREQAQKQLQAHAQALQQANSNIKQANLTLQTAEMHLQRQAAELDRLRGQGIYATA